MSIDDSKPSYHLHCLMYNEILFLFRFSIDVEVVQHFIEECDYAVGLQTAYKMATVIIGKNDNVLKNALSFDDREFETFLEYIHDLTPTRVTFHEHNRTG